jgi:hypothetical protein
MDRHVQASIALGAPLAAVALGCALLFMPQPQKTVVAVASLEHCRRAAELLYDVHWATACAAAGQADPDACMLPEHQAARVNAILATEETRCLAAEAHAARHQ